MTSELSAFNELFTTYKNRFVRFAQTYISDAAVSEDFVIDSLIYYWENRKRLGENVNVPAYVLTVIKHKCLNYLQHQCLCKDVAEEMLSHEQWKLQTRIATLEACEPYELYSDEIRKIVNDTLNSLPTRTREIFIMSRLENISYKEIAERLDMTTKGVEFHMSKALKQLRFELKDYFPFIYLLILN